MRRLVFFSSRMTELSVLFVEIVFDVRVIGSFSVLRLAQNGWVHVADHFELVNEG